MAFTVPFNVHILTFDSWAGCKYVIFIFNIVVWMLLDPTLIHFKNMWKPKKRGTNYDYGEIVAKFKSNLPNQFVSGYIKYKAFKCKAERQMLSQNIQSFLEKWTSIEFELISKRIETSHSEKNLTNLRCKWRNRPTNCPFNFTISCEKSAILWTKSRTMYPIKCAAQRTESEEIRIDWGKWRILRYSNGKRCLSIYCCYFHQSMCIRFYLRLCRDLKKPMDQKYYKKR